MIVPKTGNNYHDKRLTYSVKKDTGGREVVNSWPDQQVSLHKHRQSQG